MKAKTIKHRRKCKRKTLSCGLDKGILDTPKAQPIKEKSHKLTLSKYKLYPVKRMKNKPHTGRKYLPITYLTKDLTQNI